MTIEEVYIVLQEWIVGILVTEEGLTTLKVIRGNQNAPSPAKPYMVIHQPPISNRPTGLTGNFEKADDTGKVNYSIPYEASITIEEVGGIGDLLNLLLESINRQDIKDFFKLKFVSIVRVEASVDSTDTKENIHELRDAIDIHINYTTQKDYAPGFIETVEPLTGEYSGTRNP